MKDVKEEGRRVVLRPSLTCFSPEENGSAATPD